MPTDLPEAEPHPTIERLNPETPLVKAVTDWLARRAERTPAGANSLAHIMVVAPTAQAGRRLRLALAQRFAGGIVPPGVAQPISLVKPADAALKTATPLEARAALAAFLSRADRSQWPNLFPAAAEPETKDAQIAALGTLSLADQLGNIWETLAAGGLLMADVAAQAKQPGTEVAKRLEEALGNEVGRWQDLADLEAGYFDLLHKADLRHTAEANHLACENPAPLPGGIDTIVLPALLDPAPAFIRVLKTQMTRNPSLKVIALVEGDAAAYDEWGLPKESAWTAKKDLPVLDEQIHLAGSPAEQADLAARFFPERDPKTGAPKQEPPALGMADAGMFPDLAAAFETRGYTLHNPERHRLGVSSLGRIAANLFTLLTWPRAQWAWAPFAGLLRESDVRAWLKAQGLNAEAVLAEADGWQNAHLPKTMPAVAELKDDKDNKDKHRVNCKTLRSAIAALETLLSTSETDASDVGRGRFPAEAQRREKEDEPIAALNEVLKKLYSVRPQDSGRAKDREFAAAAEALADLLDAMREPVEAALEPGLRQALFLRELGRASYQLEPETTDVVRTDGWLELAWTPEAAVVVTGFNEGFVPDSIVGHPFLPDLLRAALGLETNVKRYARDICLFDQLLRSHKVQVFCGMSDARGEVLKPSRILFLCPDERLAARVQRLFKDKEQQGKPTCRCLPPGWHFTPPMNPKPPDHLSPSAIDNYLNCPFTFLLQNVLKMEPFQEKEELGFNDYGTLCHSILQAYADEEKVKDEAGQLTDEAEIAVAFERLAKAEFARFKTPDAGLQLQLDSIRSRLRKFAKIQSEWRKAGWRIVAAEQEVRPTAIKQCAPFKVTGTIDRVDVNAFGNFCVIDYKTWDKPNNAFKDHIATDSAGPVAEAAKRGLTFMPAGSDKEWRWLTLQLPLYGLLLMAKEPGKYNGKIVDYRYAVLGDDSAQWVGGLPLVDKTAETKSGKKATVKSFAIVDELDKAYKALAVVVSQIKAGIFWPPDSKKKWQYNYAPLFLAEPGAESEIDDDWCKAQGDRLEEWNANHRPTGEEAGK